MEFLDNQLVRKTKWHSTFFPIFTLKICYPKIYITFIKQAEARPETGYHLARVYRTKPTCSNKEFSKNENTMWNKPKYSYMYYYVLKGNIKNVGISNLKMEKYLT